MDKAQPTSTALETKKVTQIPSNSVELFAHVTGTRMAFRDDIGYETEAPREDVKHLMRDVFGNTFKVQKRNIEAYFGLSFQEVIKQGYLKKSITEQMLHAHEKLKKTGYSFPLRCD